MQGKLQQTYKVSRELSSHASFSGVMLLTQMPRLAELVIADDTGIPVTFEFGYNEFKLPTLTGHYEADLKVECQRCLEPMVKTIKQDFALLIDASEEDIESFQLDSLYSQEGYLDVVEVIEDELILALPIIMMHEDINCNKFLQVDAEQPPVKTNNPFAALQALKGND